MKKDYVEQSKATFALQLITFKNNIGPCATLLDVSATEVASEAADADNYNYIITSTRTMEQAAQQWSSWSKLMRVGGSPPPTGAPVAPILGAGPTAVDLGIEERFRKLVQRIKEHPITTPPSAKRSGSKETNRPRPTWPPSSRTSSSSSPAARS